MKPVTPSQLLPVKRQPIDGEPQPAICAKKDFCRSRRRIFVTSLSTVVIDEGLHPLIAEPEYAPLLHKVVIEYGVMFLSALDKKGVILRAKS